MAKTEKKVDTIIHYSSFEINGKKINLFDSLPMTLKDWRLLKEQGVSGDDLGSMEGVEKYGRYLIKKSNSEINDDDIDLLTQAELTEILNSVNEITISVVIDRSFLKPLIALPLVMDGAKPK